MTIGLQAPLFLLLLVPLGILAFILRAGQRARLFALRLAALLLLVVALAQPYAARANAGSSIVFAIDRSASISPGGQQRELTWVRSALANVPDTVHASIVPFAGDASLIRLPAHASSLPLPAPASPGTTNIENGLGLALAPASGGSRIVILSDGEQTVGDATAAAARAATEGIHIDAVDPRVLRTVSIDAAITRLQAPSGVHEGDSLPLFFTVRSSVRASASVTLSQDGHPRGSETVRLQPGDNPYLLRLTAGKPGWHSYGLAVSMDGDAVPQNNRLDTVTDVGSPPRVLVASTSRASAGQLVTLLRRHGITVTLGAVRSLPRVATGYGHEDGVILDDIPADALRRRQVAALDEAVRRNSLGLFVLGGRHSLTLGHYSLAPLERLLPVLSVPPGSLRPGNVALQLVMDRSGSMNNLAGNVPKIEMAQAAADIAINFAARYKDQLGVTSFDQVPHTLIPLQPVGKSDNARRMHAIVNHMTADGGTDIYAALKAGARQVLTSKATFKHIILMTDGVSNPAHYAPLIRTLRAEHVTLSTVGLGSDADIPLLKRLARAGSGRFYYTANASQLPHIFAKEVRLSAGPVKVTGAIPVSLAAGSPVVRDLRGSGLPDVHGYPATTLKSGAVAALVAHSSGRQNDNILAQWQYGLGRVLVWTPGTDSSWAGNWLTKQPGFWNDAARWIDRAAPPSILTPTVSESGTSPALTIDTVNENGAMNNLARLEATIVSPNNKKRSIMFTQTAPGQYSAGLGSGHEGVYHVAVTDLQRGTRQISLVAAPYPPEYTLTAPNTALLTRLTEISGGHMLESPAALGNELTSGAGTVALWWPIALVALLLACVDMAWRALQGGTGWSSRPTQLFVADNITE